ncbi:MULTISPECIES: anthranilate synthase component I [unclassified Staphylococcus]|uniref:anthranilate synthase component I n=1 Tax=unclassified Staphylococcus TaxID=91994 RepID=UPI0021CEB667|nr:MULTISPECIES: anthranilate synthase component I [unclassified Staphylococcus]UXR76082.1 anthranilate synthase component I [Staphylococcus sp. IVB6233]UXR80280.1 anthranilate synthase component I [Staphylococcus sp. IVB6218]
MEIYYRVIDAPVNPETLARHKQHKILFESATTNQTKGRYSILAFDVCGEIVLTDKALTVKTPQKTEVIEQSPLEALKAYVAKKKVDVTDESLSALPFISGFMGAFSFDFVRHAYPVLQQYPIEGSGADVHIYMVEQVYVFDHFKECVYVVATNLFSNVSREVLESRVTAMIEEFQQVELFEPPLQKQLPAKEIKTSVDDETFKQYVSDFKDYICQGDMFQAVPSRIYHYEHHFEEQRDRLTFRLFQRLKRNNPSPYLFYVNMGQDILVGSSPESFVKVKGLEVMTNPIAGTIRRGKDVDEDTKLAETLLADEKELSEHRMLVDLGRNDILRIAEHGSLKIPQLMTIERYEHVMHIVSEVTGQLPQDYSPIDVIASLLPTGTVSGAPKLRAIQRIYEQQPVRRGVYSGGVGYINCNHDLDLALAIRTMVIDETNVRVEAGCGVVYDSIPEKELEETRLKAKSLLEVEL